MDQKWKSALILIPLIVLVGGIWMFRSRPESSDGCTSPPGIPTELKFTVTPPAPGVPGAVARVSLTWTPPASGDAPTMYVVEAGSAPGASNVGNYVSSTASFSTDAPPGTYYGRVRAQNACGSSEPSSEIEVKVP